MERRLLLLAQQQSSSPPQPLLSGDRPLRFFKYWVVFGFKSEWSFPVPQELSPDYFKLMPDPAIPFTLKGLA